MFKKTRLALLPLASLMYLVVSGGPYGIEDAVRLAGPRLALLLCLVVPLTLSLPTALMAAELTALLPMEGGFYFWVKEALGPFAGFAEVYLTILYTAVDSAIYPVLFVTYLTSLFPASWGAQVVIAIALVWSSGLLNVMGVRLVGDISIALTAAVAAPFAALVALGLPRLINWQLPIAIPAGGHLAGRLGGGLSVVIWNYCGWENLSVVAAEIEDPRRNYLRATAIVVPAVTLGYILPLAVCLSGTTGGTNWHTGSFAEQGRRIGGPLVETAIAIGGVLSAFAIFDAAMLWVSRLPFVLARERYLPSALARLWRGAEIPAPAILVCCIVFTMLIPLGFLTLVVLDVFFYMMALVLEMIALIRLRRLYPRRDGLFVIGGGTATLYLVALAPLSTWLATFGLAVSNGANDMLIATTLAAGAWPVYSLLQRHYGGPPHPASP
jgi:amino acid transporter